VPNNLDPIPILVFFSLQQLIDVTANNPPTINAIAFVDLVEEFFRILELKFPVKSFEKNLKLATFFRQMDETFKRLLKLKDDT
jgi:hypothetical protein